MKAKSKKAKGTRLEVLIAKLLRDSGLDKNAKKQPRSGAYSGFEGDIFTDLPFHFEAKNQETWKPLEYWKQAERDCPQNKMPVVVMSKNREDAFAFLKLTDLIHIIKLAHETGFLLTRGFTKEKQLKKPVIADNIDLPFSKNKQLGVK